MKIPFTVRAQSVVGAAVLALCAAPALAQTEAPILVTGTRSAIPLDSYLGDASVMTREQIAAAQGRTLVELLSSLAGLQFIANGTAGTSSSLFARGLEARHTLLLIDGVRYGSATLGTPAWENIPLAEIERIEVVRGPLSSWYGSAAAGAVVQIFTRRGKEGFHPSAAVSFGNLKQRALQAGAQFGSGPFTGSINLTDSEQKAGSVTNERVPFGNFNADEDGFKQTSISGGLNFALNDRWSLSARALGSKGRVQIDDGPRADALAKLGTDSLSLALNGQDTAGGWSTQLRVGRTKDAYETVRSASPFSDLGTISTEQDQIGWDASLQTGMGKVSLALERVTQEVARPVRPFAVSRRVLSSIGLGLVGEAGPHSWQASLRQDKNSQFGNAATGSLAYGISLSKALRLEASYGTSFNAPSFNQLYFPGFGNPLLQPEEGKSSELAAVWKGSFGQLRAAWFDQRVRGFITSGPAPVNLPRIRADGYSLSWQGTALGHLMSASLDTVDPRNASSGTANFGKQLPRRAKHSAKLDVTTPKLGAWQFGGAVQAYSERFDNTANTLRVGGFGILDLRASYAVSPELKLSMKLNNATDKRYETVYGYNQPRRAFLLGFEYRR